MRNKEFGDWNAFSFQMESLKERKGKGVSLRLTVQIILLDLRFQTVGEDLHFGGSATCK